MFTRILFFPLLMLRGYSSFSFSQKAFSSLCVFCFPWLFMLPFHALHEFCVSFSIPYLSEIPFVFLPFLLLTYGLSAACGGVLLMSTLQPNNKTLRELRALAYRLIAGI